MLFNIVRQSKRLQDVENKPCTKAYWNGERWQITLTSIEDLNNLIEEVGDIVIEKEPESKYDIKVSEIKEITIYDEYIE
jgi:hypothetical protein